MVNDTTVNIVARQISILMRNKVDAGARTNSTRRQSMERSMYGTDIQYSMVNRGSFNEVEPYYIIGDNSSRSPRSGGVIVGP